MRRRVVPVLVAAVALAGCGDDGDRDPVELIESVLADEIGLGDLDGRCDRPADPDVGATFGCTGTTDDGRTIEFEAVVEAEDSIYVYALNVVEESVMRDAEALVAERLSPELDESIEPGDVDCPDETVVLDAAGGFECILTLASSGERSRVRVTPSDFVRDEGYATVEVTNGAPITE